MTEGPRHDNLGRRAGLPTSQVTSSPPFLNRVVYAANIIGAAGALVGTLILVWGPYEAPERLAV